MKFLPTAQSICKTAFIAFDELQTPRFFPSGQRFSLMADCRPTRYHPNQEYLIQPTPDLRPLREWLFQRYNGRSVGIEEIYSDLQDPATGTFYLKPHLHEVIKELHRTGYVRGPEKIVFSKKHH
jgi:hypothetical protein